MEYSVASVIYINIKNLPFYPHHLELIATIIQLTKSIGPSIPASHERSKSVVL
jgi:hypothetical protein